VTNQHADKEYFVKTWDLLGNGNLFRTTGGPEDKQDNVYHLAHMIALLGSPPKEFLERTKGGRIRSWFDENGMLYSF
jgi:serine/threonine-protein kinase SRPK3